MASAKQLEPAQIFSDMFVSFRNNSYLCTQIILK